MAPSDDYTWHDLHSDHGVLELHERLTAGLGLELHLAADPETGGTLAWWLTDRGEWLGAVEVGEA